ncbi:hypothetical protein PGK05_04255 [Acinetobacter baumannii]|nr:hypothetical protein [Acinetobacter baumannii]
MNVQRHVYTDEEAVELRTAHMLAKNIMGHSYPQNVIEAAEKRSEEDFERIVSGEVTRAEVETELLLQWNKKMALQQRISELEKELKDGQEILNNWKNTEDPLFERHKSCVEGQCLRLDEMRKVLISFG